MAVPLKTLLHNLREHLHIVFNLDNGLVDHLGVLVLEIDLCTHSPVELMGYSHHLGQFSLVPFRFLATVVAVELDEFLEATFDENAEGLLHIEADISQPVVDAFLNGDTLTVASL